MERTRNLPKVTQLESMSEPRLTLRVPPITTVGTASIPYPAPPPKTVAYVDQVLTLIHNQEPTLGSGIL